MKIEAVLTFYACTFSWCACKLDSCPRQWAFFTPRHIRGIVSGTHKAATQNVSSKTHEKFRAGLAFLTRSWRLLEEQLAVREEGLVVTYNIVVRTGFLYLPSMESVASTEATVQWHFLEQCWRVYEYQCSPATASGVCSDAILHL
jgi:hypothetical protein